MESSDAGGEPRAGEPNAARFGRWGEQVGASVGAAGRSARRAAASLTTQAPPAPASADQATAPTSRAEAVVARVSDRARPLASVIALRAQRMFARAREEVEDIWAEAESLRERGRMSSSVSTTANTHRTSGPQSTQASESEIPPRAD